MQIFQRTLPHARATSGWAAFFLVLLAMLACGSSGWASCTVLVLDSSEVRKSGVGDLTRRLLSAAEGVQVVGREFSDPVVREIAPERLAEADGTADRERLGKKSGADLVVLLAKFGSPADPRFRLVIGDGPTGTRLYDETLDLDPMICYESATHVRDAVLAVRAAQPQGVMHVVSLAPLTAENLPPEFAHLPVRFTDLLRLSLECRPGVAVVGADEAPSPASPPTRICGSLRLESDGTGAPPTLRFTLRIARPGVAEETVSHGPEGLAAAAGILASGVVQQALPDSRPVTPEQLFDQLATRADTMTSLAEWAEAARLREAALMLRPDNVAQRLNVLADYRETVALSGPRIGIEERINMDNPAHLRAIRCGVDAYVARFAHVEYLVRERAVSVTAAADEANRAITDHPNVAFYVEVSGGVYRRLGQEQLAIAEASKERFILRVMPRLRRWVQEPIRGAARALDTWTNAVTGGTLTRWDRQYRTREDLDFVRNVLLDVLPDNTPLDRSMSNFIERQGGRASSWVPGVPEITEQDWLGFLAGLEAAPSRNCQEYAKLGRATFTPRDPPAPHRASATSLPTPPPPPIRRHWPTGEWTLPGRGRNTRFGFERLGLMIRDRDGSLVPAKGVKYRIHTGWFQLEHVVQCGENLDIWWHGGAILFMREPGILEEVFIEPNARFEDVRWDGRFVWVSSRWVGVWVVRPDGTVVARFQVAEGFPPATNGMRLQTLGEGRAIVVGSYGPTERAWCATVEINDQGGAVKVFHEARRYVTLSQSKTLKNDLDLDPNIGFRPGWIHDYEAKDGSRRILVGRDARYGVGEHHPLEIDPETLKVGVFGRRLHASAEHATNDTYLSRRGLLLEASALQGVKLYPPPGESFPRVVDAKELCAPRTEPRDDCVFDFGGLLITPGSWHQIDPDTWESKLITSDGPPHSGRETPGHYGVSAHYGLVGWDAAGFFRFVDLEPAPVGETVPSSGAKGEATVPTGESPK